MKITTAKNINIVNFGGLKIGEVFTYKGANPDTIYLKMLDTYSFDSRFAEQLLEGCADSEELDECAVNCVNLKNGEMRYFSSTDDIIKVEAEVIVHN